MRPTVTLLGTLTAAGLLALTVPSAAQAAGAAGVGVRAAAAPPAEPCDRVRKVAPPILRRVAAGQIPLTTGMALIAELGGTTVPVVLRCLSA
ncbi:hypothetical protein Misp01_43040 [Microtetraspora sp. NBRC 13810]|uniref:hypothetical protein n=1 Tax=Microtetraspora sp. NBRC 13810 TaxID=3030990 RepID=UPI0024A5EC80|nr:hypothetical protein [Microtetraspora sp. NBRC 13810]GLW09175.1 hypothetical protein Misp01_43040 [Microtetraspora sp. NBRC 13810]